MHGILRTISSNIYFLPGDPLASEVLVPGFRGACRVHGAFGWFTADWIGRLAPGLAEYLSKKEAEPIRFTVAPIFFPNELEAAKRGIEMSRDEAARRIADVFVRDRHRCSALGKHALDCLAWMIGAERLLMRVAVPVSGSNYHPKMWLFDDGSDQVLAHGSANATDHGVSTGNEHVNVDVSWSDEGRKKIDRSRLALRDWSEGRAEGIRYTVDLPVALQREIIQVSPAQPPSLREYQAAIESDGTPRWTRDSEKALANRFRKSLFVSSAPQLTIPRTLRWQDGSYAHQGEAVSAWEKTEFPHRGILAMATGTGKTLTALICATRLQEEIRDKPLLVVISAPSVPLIKQWCAEVGKFGARAVAPTLERNRQEALTGVFRGLGAKGTQVMVITNNLLTKQEFQNSLHHYLSHREASSMLIGDEVHTLGAKGFRENSPDFFESRLGLSATPVRQYDADGTEHIFGYFGPTVFEFPLEKAIGLSLVPYDYFVHTATLNADEVERFVRLTERIKKAFAQGEKVDDEDSRLRGLLIRRREIVESTEAKLKLLREVLRLRGPESLEHVLIYASAKNPEQFEAIGEILDQLNIRWASVTERTTRNPKQMATVFEAFTSGGYQVLLAKKVLDEGVDIPSIREAFIVASSTVEREWVQRRGRLLRKQAGKEHAVVHDFLGLPPTVLTSGGDRDLQKLVLREIDRALAFARHCRNAVGTRGVIGQVQEIRADYWSSGAGHWGLNEPGSFALARETPRGKLW